MTAYGSSPVPVRFNPSPLHLARAIATVKSRLQSKLSGGKLLTVSVNNE